MYRKSRVCARALFSRLFILLFVACFQKYGGFSSYQRGFRRCSGNDFRIKLLYPKPNQVLKGNKIILESLNNEKASA